MVSRYPILYQSIQIATLLAILAGVLFPNLLLQIELVLAVLLIVFVGIPHGATDYLIFKHLSKPFLGTRRMSTFYINYLLLMAGYGLIWWFVPILGLGIFLALSMYHFGQSNWNYVDMRSSFSTGVLFFVWGAYVILAPILLHWEAASPIISSIIQQEAPNLTSQFTIGLLLGLLMVNIFLSIVLWIRGRITQRQFLYELFNLIVLSIMYWVTPLLLGFAIYFVCWHSLSSVMDQIEFFKKMILNYDWKKYIKHTLPLSLLSIVGLIGLYLIAELLGMKTEISLLFIFISIVTLPHMILIDKLYQEWEDTQNKMRLQGSNGA